MRITWWRRAGVLVAVGVVLTSAGPASAQQDPGEAVDKAARSLASESVTPFGANDWACRPDGKPPVVLVHGAAGDDGGDPPVKSQLAFASLIPVLRAHGYCVFAADLNNGQSLYYRRPAYDDPQQLVDTIGAERAPTQLDVFVNGVRRATGAKQVSLIGHSLGAPVARAFMRGGGNAAKVDDLIALGGTNLHLDDVWEQAPDLVGENPPPSVRQIFGGDGGAFLDWLNGPQHELETHPDVDYTALGLNNESLIARPFFANGGNVSNFFFGPPTVRLDSSRMPAPQCIVLPFTCDEFDVFEERAYLRSADYAVRRVCSGALVDDGGLLRHTFWAVNPHAQRVVLAALERQGPAPAGFDPCRP